MKDSDTYTDLLLRHKKLIWRLCWRYAKHDIDYCNDLLQEVSLALWEHLGSLRANASLFEEKAWVFWSTRTVLYDIRRRAEQQPAVILDREMDGLASDEGDDTGELVDELLASLAAEDRLLIRMRLDGYKAAEIGEALGMSPATVYQRIHRIIQKLKKEANEK